ncbi:MAG: ornithine--oxo-acid transaminase [Gemmatimonadota bacterium]
MGLTEAYIEQTAAWGAHNYAPLPVVLERGEGAWVWDVEGRRYLDLLAAYSALNHGHRHPRILETLAEQAGRLTLTSRAFHDDRLGPFVQELCTRFGYGRALPMNTGAEAVESALKIARKWGYERRGVPAGEADVLVFDGNFHGRTTTLVGLSSEALYRRGFGPFAPGFRRVAYGDPEAAAEAIGETTVAVLVEPIQGEAGVVVPPDGFLARLAELCAGAGALLVADEIQTGLGRTGRMLASEWEGVRPDVLVLGKALGGGVYPVSAVLADDDVMEVLTPGTHGSTFGGNALAAAVARTAVRVLDEEGLVERAAELGPWLRDELRGIESPHVAEVRGRGLMIGIELVADSPPARHFCESLIDHGVLARDTHERVIRIAPPLVVEPAQLERAIDALARALRAT